MTASSKSRWGEVAFEELVAHSAFGPRFSGSAYADDGNIATLRTTDLDNDGRISYEKMPLAQLDEGPFENHFLAAGDLVITRSGTCGIAAVFEEFILPVLPGAFLIRFRMNDRAESHFYRYYFNSPSGRSNILSVARGAVQQNINITNVKSLRVPLPPISEQRQIVRLLSAYDDLIENNRRRMALLEDAARQLHREWFVRLRFPGHEHTRIVDGVPEGWEKIYLGDAVDTQYGFTETATDEPVGPKFLRGTDINKAPFIDWSTVPYCPIDEILQRKYQLRVGDILIIRMADPGKVAIVERNIDAVFASYLIRLLPTDPRLTPYYLFYVLSEDAYQGFISGVSTGSTRKTASAPLLVDFHFLLPPQTLRRMFEDSVRPLRQQITTLLVHNEKLRAARDLLLPRLMNGEVTA